MSEILIWVTYCMSLCFWYVKWAFLSAPYLESVFHDLKFFLIYFNWTFITLQYYDGFCHTSIWIGHSKIWSTSRICVSSLYRGHTNHLCINPVLVCVLPKWVLNVVLSQLLCSSLSPSSKSSLVSLHFLPLEWYHLHIRGCWYFSGQSWFQLVIRPAWHFAWCTLNIS